MRTNFNFKLLIFLIIFIISFSSVSAISLYFPPNRKIIFEPNLIKTFSFYAFNNVGRDIDVLFTKEGDLAEYISFQPNTMSLRPEEKKPFVVILTLPNDLEPGEHKALIGIEEDRKNTDVGINVKGSVSVPITVRKRFLGIYPVISVGGDSSEIGEPANIIVHVTNLGDKDILFASAKVSIYDLDNNYLGSVDTDTKLVKYDETSLLEGILDTKGFNKGDYILNATVDCDGKIYTGSGKLRLGELNVNILDYTNKFQKGIIQKLDVSVKNDWNKRIGDLYGTIQIYNSVGSEIALIKTPITDLDPWQIKTITGYWDLKNIDIGKYNANLTVYYNNLKSTETITLEVEEDLGMESVELPKSSFSLSSSTMLIILIAILVILNMLLYFYLKNSDDNKKGGKNRK